MQESTDLLRLEMILIVLENDVRDDRVAMIRFDLCEGWNSDLLRWRTCNDGPKDDWAVIRCVERDIMSALFLFYPDVLVLHAGVQC